MKTYKEFWNSFEFKFKYPNIFFYRYFCEDFDSLESKKIFCFYKEGCLLPFYKITTYIYIYKSIIKPHNYRPK